MSSLIFSSDHKQRVFEDKPLGFLWLKGDSIIHANQGCENWLGINKSQLLNQSFSVIFASRVMSSEDSSSFREWFKRVQLREHQDESIIIVSKGSEAVCLSASYLENTALDEMGDITIIAIHPLVNHQQHLSEALNEFLNGDPVPTFVLGVDHSILHWNRACSSIIGCESAKMVGTKNQWQAFYPDSEPRPTLADLVLDNDLQELAYKWYGEKIRPSPILPNAYEAEDFFPHMGDEGRWLLFTATPIHDKNGRLIGAIETLIDITELKRVEDELEAAYRSE
ncbi:MAG: PAS domain-containing protein [Pseudomonadota bacterium]